VADPRECRDHDEELVDGDGVEQKLRVDEERRLELFESRERRGVAQQLAVDLERIENPREPVRVGEVREDDPAEHHALRLQFARIRDRVRWRRLRPRNEALQQVSGEMDTEESDPDDREAVHVRPDQLAERQNEHEGARMSPEILDAVEEQREEAQRDELWSHDEALVGDEKGQQTDEKRHRNIFPAVVRREQRAERRTDQRDAERA